MVNLVTCNFILLLPAGHEYCDGIERKIRNGLRYDNVKSLCITPAQGQVSVVWSAEEKDINIKSLNTIREIAYDLGCEIIQRE